MLSTPADPTHFGGAALRCQESIDLVGHVVRVIVVQVAHRSSLNDTDECPAHVLTAFGFAPAATMIDTNECRRS